MSAKKSNPTRPEGWESLAEEAEGGSLAANPELEAALREAAEAVEGYADQSSEARARCGDDPIAAGVERTEEDLRAEVADLKDRMLRLQAEFDNFRKRALKERQEALQYGHQNLVKDLLSAVDNLDRALEHSRTSESGDLEGLLQGVELVQRELLGALAKHGVTKVEAQGKPFDPSVHEAMVQTPDSSVPENTVLDVFEVGYKLRDRLLRPARVVVAKAPGDESKDEDRGGDGG